MDEFMNSRPQFSVTVVPVAPEDVRISLNNLCMYLRDINLEDMRKALETSGNTPYLGNLRGPFQMEVHLIPRPLNLGIIFRSRFESILVRISPDDFDQSIEEQRVLYGKCICILEILSAAPVRETKKQIIVSRLIFGFNKSEAERKAWGKILKRWKGKQQLPSSQH